MHNIGARVESMRFTTGQVGEVRLRNGPSRYVTGQKFSIRAEHIHTDMAAYKP